MDQPKGLLTLDELTKRVGISVRNVRFYTTKGLVPPPLRRGRSGYYTAEHVARLELVRELQSHGFTLAAIERYLANVPDNASPEEIALQRTMLAPWQSETPLDLTRGQLEERVGRALSDEEITTLEALGVLTRQGRRLAVSASQLSVAMSMLDLGLPPEAARAAARVYTDHGQQIAKELYDVFRTMVWPVYRDSNAPPQALREMVERLKPLSIASLVSAYEAAMDETKRQGIRRRSS